MNEIERLFTRVILSMLILCVGPLTWAADWELMQTVEGVNVYKREIPGSSVLAFKGDGDVSAPIEKVATVIFDTTRATEWIEDLEQSKIVKWLSPTDYIEYDHFGTPFIMKDRDFVSKVSIAIDAGKKSISFIYASTVDASVPETSYVRGSLQETAFILTPTANGGTHVVGEIHCDPNGSVPKWIVNFFQKDWPIDTFKSLRKQSAKTDIKLDPHFEKPF